MVIKKAVSDQIRYYSTYEKVGNNPRYRKAWKFIEERSGNNSKVLDVGCADGSFCQKLISKGIDCYGLEVANQALKVASKTGLKTKKGSFLEPFPFEGNFFDFVYAGEVLEHTLDDESFLKQCFRTLKPKGVLILTVPNLVSLENRFLMFLGKLPQLAYAPYHYKIYTAKLLEEKLKLVGFRILRLDSSYVLVSKNYNWLAGSLGEWLGTQFPTLGKNLIFYAQRY